ncbi:fungal-specific transcription factor domain-containing protein [Dipodascopsis uninucleata]
MHRNHWCNILDHSAYFQANISDVGTNSMVPSDSTSDRTPSAGNRKRKSRARGLRVKTGCLVCRKRHLKCDETRPICSQCAKGSRLCAYPTDGTSSCISPEKGQPYTLQREQQQQERQPNSQSPLPDSESGKNRSPGSNASEGNATKSVATSGDCQSKDVNVTSTGVSNSQDDFVALRAVGASSRCSSDKSPRSFSDQLSQCSYDLPLQQQPSNLLDFAQNSTSSDPSVTALRGLARSAGFEDLSSDLASIKWLDLLAADAAETDASFSLASFTDCNSLEPSREGSPIPLESVDPQETVNDIVVNSGRPITLSKSERAIFNHFVLCLSRWIDIFDPDATFATDVATLALRNEGLLIAILALSARHLSLKNESQINFSQDALQYYYRTLRYLQSALKNAESYTKSDELIAITLVVSTYEMLGGSRSGWERHLKGVFWIQRSLNIHGSSGGIREAVWWAWLRQDVWVALRERRRVLTFWKPDKQCCDLSSPQLANRIIFLFAQAVNYSSKAETATVEFNLQRRLDKADALISMLSEWRAALGRDYEPLTVMDEEDESYRVFRPIRFRASYVGVALQFYHFTRIIIATYRPMPVDCIPFKEKQATKRLIEESVATICGIAHGQDEKDSACALYSTQCLYGAALCVTNPVEKQEILELIRKRQRVTHWPSYELSDELQD